MKGDHYEALGLEYRRQSDKLLSRCLVIGLLLLLSHMLQITPKEFDAGGAKIEIKDPVIIQGSLAILYLHTILWANAVSRLGSSFVSLRPDRQTARSLLKRAYKPFKDAKTSRMRTRTPKEAKKYVWWQDFWFNIFMIPYALILVLGILFALIVALVDAARFSVYVWHQPWDFGFGTIVAAIESWLG
jgi:hypothetical protein